MAPWVCHSNDAIAQEISQKIEPGESAAQDDRKPAMVLESEYGRVIKILQDLHAASQCQHCQGNFVGRSKQQALQGCIQEDYHQNVSHERANPPIANENGDEDLDRKDQQTGYQVNEAPSPFRSH